MIEIYCYDFQRPTSSWSNDFINLKKAENILSHLNSNIIQLVNVFFATHLKKLVKLGIISPTSQGNSIKIFVKNH